MSTVFQQTIDFDTSLIMADTFGPAEPVTLIAENGMEFLVQVLYESPNNDLKLPSSYAPIIVEVPTLYIQSSLVISLLGRDLSNKDKFLVGEKLYKVQNPEKDGYGLVKIKLLEARNV